RVGVCCCERRGAGVLCVGAKAWAFAPKESFTWQRNRHEIQDAIMKAPTTYVTPPRGHTVDPFNPDQGFYGVLWGRIRPLTPRFGNIADYGPGIRRGKTTASTGTTIAMYSSTAPTGRS